MHTILSRTQLSDNVVRLRVAASLIAEARSPGQFVIVQVDTDFGERVPLTIANANSSEGWVELIFQTVGATTLRLAEYSQGEALPALLGPLGQPTHVENFGRAVCVGGGIGVAPMYPIAQALKAAGNHLSVIIGARNRELILLKEEMADMADDLIVVTDDGSYGRKALVTEPLRELCESDSPPDIVVAIGPPVMMKFAAETTRPYGVHTVVSLNSIMVDGTGMCGGCRVTVGEETKFVCVEGPEFDGHAVDFDNMIKRLQAYKPQEDRARSQCMIDIRAKELTK